MTTKYFYVVNRYKDPFGISGHVVEANSRSDAFRITATHNISNRSGVVFRKTITKAVIDQIKRRKKHVGGKIWYEDSNGDLQFRPYTK